MGDYRNIILKNICYTDLVYDRIRKKLSIDLSNSEIEKYIYLLVQTTLERDIERIGKNYYLSNKKEAVRITVNSYTTRVITVDRL